MIDTLLAAWAKQLAGQQEQIHQSNGNEASECCRARRVQLQAGISYWEPSTAAEEKEKQEISQPEIERQEAQKWLILTSLKENIINQGFQIFHTIS